MSRCHWVVAGGNWYTVHCVCQWVSIRESELWMRESALQVYKYICSAGEGGCRWRKVKEKWVAEQDTVSENLEKESESEVNELQEKGNGSQREKLLLVKDIRWRKVNAVYTFRKTFSLLMERTHLFRLFNTQTWRCVPNPSSVAESLLLSSWYIMIYIKKSVKNPS